MSLIAGTVTVEIRGQEEVVDPNGCVGNTSKIVVF